MLTLRLYAEYFLPNSVLDRHYEIKRTHPHHESAAIIFLSARIHSKSFTLSRIKVSCLFSGYPAIQAPNIYCSGIPCPKRNPSISWKHGKGLHLIENQRLPLFSTGTDLLVSILSPTLAWLLVAMTRNLTHSVKRIECLEKDSFNISRTKPSFYRSPLLRLFIN
jgi:hypothetical protein